jgi:Mg-chelatase subunit ChlD
MTFRHIELSKPLMRALIGATAISMVGGYVALELAPRSLRIALSSELPFTAMNDGQALAFDRLDGSIAVLTFAVAWLYATISLRWHRLLGRRSFTARGVGLALLALAAGEPTFEYLGDRESVAVLNADLLDSNRDFKQILADRSRADRTRDDRDWLFLPIEARAVAQPQRNEALGDASQWEAARLNFDPHHRRKVLWIHPAIASKPSLGPYLRIVRELDEAGVAMAELAIDSPKAPLALGALEVATTVQMGQAETAHLNLTSDGPREVFVEFQADGQAIALPEGGRFELRNGDNRIALAFQAARRGPLRLRAAVRSADAASPPVSEVALTWSLSPPRVVVVSPPQLPQQTLVAALEAGHLSVASFDPAVFDADSQALVDQDLLILNDVAAAMIGEEKEAAIKSFVEHGGGLIMLGSRHAFGFGEWQTSEVRKVLPVSWKGEIEREEPTLALVLVIDRSGSMANQDKLELVKEAARLTSNTLAPDDLIGVIAFDSSPQVVVNLQPAGSRLRIASAIGRLTPGGGTDVLPALREAYVALRSSRAKIKHVIVLSDGQSPRAGLESLSSAMRDAAITVSAVGVGSGAGQDLLAEIAQQGSGRFYFSRDGTDVPQIFSAETRQMARRSAEKMPRRVNAPLQDPITRGIDWAHAPALAGVVPLQAKERSRTLLRSDRGEAVLVSARFGLGRSAAFAADAQGPFAKEWPHWQVAPRFWHQLARGIMRQENAHEPLLLRTYALDDGGDFEVLVDAHLLGFAGALRCEATLHLARRSEAAPAAPSIRKIELHRVAPDLWKGRFQLFSGERALIEASLRREEDHQATREVQTGEVEAGGILAHGVGVSPHPANGHEPGADAAQHAVGDGAFTDIATPADLDAWLAQPGPAPEQAMRAPLWSWLLLLGALPAWLAELYFRQKRSRPEH